MKLVTKTLLTLALLTTVAVNAGAALIEAPYAMFQGSATINNSDGSYSHNTVRITEYTIASPSSPTGYSTVNSSAVDSFIGQAVDIYSITGFSFNMSNTQNPVSIADTASAQFRVGTSADPYLTATIRDIQMTNISTGPMNSVFVNLVASLNDQVYNHTNDSPFMAAYLAASSGSNPQGRIFTWAFTIPSAVTAAVTIAGVSGAITPAPVPVPAAVWLLGSGLAGLGVVRRRR